MSQIQRNIGWVGKRPFDIYLAPLKSVLRIRREINSPIKSERILSLTNDRGVIPYEEKGAIGNNVSEDISRYSIVHIGDIVMNSMNVIIGSVGLSKYDGALSPVYYVLQPVHKDQMDMRYFAYHFGMPAFYKQLARIGYGILEHRMRIPWINLQNELMFVPPIAKQKAIADYLDRETTRIDALIEKKRGMINLLDHRWSNKLREIVEVQPQAEIMQLRRCVEKIVSGNWGGEPGTSAVEALCIRAGDFDFQTYSANSGVMRSFSTEDVEKSRLREGDLIVEKSGGGEESPVGRVVEWKSYEVAIPTNFAAGVRANKRVSRKYLLYLFAACYSSRLTTRSIKQTTGIQNLDMGSYLSEKVPVPSLTVQGAIVERLDKTLSNIRALQNCLEVQIEVLRERRRALITAAVTGELEIPEVAA